MAIIPVIGQLLINDPSVHVLVTTGTVTGPRYWWRVWPTWQDMGA
ncbi:hypothetical protein RAA17_17400 [Komagataeibacter rhaeticus]|nr:hypothetical protein [Komagataeibacter rhaeticus]